MSFINKTFSEYIIIHLSALTVSFVIIWFVFYGFPNIYEKIKKINFRQAFLIVISFIIIYIICFSFFSIYRYESLVPRGNDLGNMVQPIWNTLRGNLFRLTFFDSVSTRLAFHVEPILLGVSLFFAPWQDPRWLLILQSVWLALGAIPVFLIASVKLKNNLAAILLAVAYLLNPALHQANGFDFHFLSLAPTFLLFAFYFLLKNNYKTSYILFILATFCREEIGLMVFLFGLYIFFTKSKKWGSIIGLTGLVWSIIAIFIILPIFSPSGESIYLSRYERYGENSLQAIKNLILNPLLPFEEGMALGRLNYIIYLMTPFAFTPILAPSILFVGVLSFGAFFLIDKPGYMIGLTHHESILLPALVLASIFGISWLAKKIKKFSPSKVTLLITLIIFLTSAQLLVYHQWTLLSFKNSLGTNYEAAEVAAAKEGLKLIPPKVSVVASPRLASHLANRENIYYIHSPHRNLVDYIFVYEKPDDPCEEDDKNQTAGFLNCTYTAEEYEKYLNEIKNNPDYELIYDKEGFFIFRKSILED